MSDQLKANFIRLTFISLSLLAFYTIWITSFQKGFLQHLIEGIATGKLSDSPDADTRLLESVTGVPTLDIRFKSLIICFWPVVDGENPSLSYLAVPVVASMGVSYILLALEARRTRSLLSTTWRLAWFGLLQTVYAQAFFLPIYCAIAFTPGKNGNGFRPLSHVKNSLILCFYTGMVLVALPSPTVIPYGLKQAVLALMVPWSLWLFVMVFVASYLFPVEGTQANNRRELYIFALAISATTHLGALLATLLHTDLGLADVFLPPLPWSITRFEGATDAMANFLKWDHLIASVTVILWAVAVYLRDCDERVDWRRLGLEVCGLSLVISPAGAAVLLIWRLDEMLSRKGNAKKE